MVQQFCSNVLVLFFSISYTSNFELQLERRRTFIMKRFQDLYTCELSALQLVHPEACQRIGKPLQRFAWNIKSPKFERSGCFHWFMTQIRSRNWEFSSRKLWALPSPAILPPYCVHHLRNVMLSDERTGCGVRVCQLEYTRTSNYHANTKLAYAGEIFIDEA